MNLLEILYTLTIMPLRLFFEVIYIKAYKILDNPGYAIIALSLAINFLILPLYRRADKIQNEEQEIEQRLKKGVSHIKKSFKGDERTMVLHTYYKQNHYKPTDVFKGSLSLLLEIPFFIAAYQFLSSLTLLHGASLGPIANLGVADNLITIRNNHFNLLPLIMTLINILSTAIFTHGYPTKTKMQLYFMALFFLIFLYNSPSGLVLYWTLNNFFSLIKTILYKLSNPRKIICSLLFIIGLFIIVYGLFFYNAESIRRYLFVLLLGFSLTIPYVLSHFSFHRHLQICERLQYTHSALLILCEIYLSIFVGIVIPSLVIYSSPQEFIDISFYYNPIWYIVSTFCISLGFFVIWTNVFYWITPQQYKYIYQLILFCLIGSFTANYMIWGKNRSILSNTLKYDNSLNYTLFEQTSNIIVFCLILFLFLIIYVFLSRYLKKLLLILIISQVCLSTYNIAGITTSIRVARNQVESYSAHNITIPINRHGKNVIILMLDRSMNEYIPFIFEERPELLTQFSGFTYYNNVVSFGGHTIFALPSLLGGYEYTPDRINARKNEPLVSKHNESLRVLPVIFSENDFITTVSDPSLAGYQEIPDISIYDDYPAINCFITQGLFSDSSGLKSMFTDNKRNFFCYSLMKISPFCIQRMIYDDGNYNKNTISNQVITSDCLIADGENGTFMKSYNVLQNLNRMTSITDSDQNTFTMICNDTTHEPVLLQQPDYTPLEHVDNTNYSTYNNDRTQNEQTLHLSNEMQISHYHANIAALIQVGNWLDYLRENKLYDNTRIIIVADHGYGTYQLDDRVLDSGENDHLDTEYYYPLLMVKDFNSNSYNICEDFMTNADVPVLALDGLIDDPINPFTGNPITNAPKYDLPLHILASDNNRLINNTGNTFKDDLWLTIHDDVRFRENWNIIDK